MNNTRKAEWIKALRSTNYQQAEGSLYRDDKYCCLGVLLDVMGVGGFKDPSLHRGYYDLLDAFIGEEVRKDLVSMNDDQHCTFAEIADYVEKEL